MKDYTFHDVTIMIAAKSGEEAYAKLCALFSADEDVDYETLTYSVDGGEERPAHEVWPRTPSLSSLLP